MKSFFQFITESASQQAARMGLQGDGHGGWYKDGEFVAKTEKGRLKFYNKRQKVGKQDPPSTEKEKRVSNPNFVDPARQQQAEPAPAAAAPKAKEQQEVKPQYDEVEKTKGTLTVAFGRFNPPHLGHLQLMDTAAGSAKSDGGDYMIVPSRSQDPKKNPLDADSKVKVMQDMFPQHKKNIANDAGTRTIFDVLKKAHNDGYANVRIVGGADRVKEFEKLSNSYNGKLYNFDKLEVVSAGDRDPDSDGVEGLSASRMRLAASENDFKKFSSGMPSDMKPEKAKEIFAMVRRSMGINESKRWEIAPKFYPQNLRENYLNKKIFDIGTLVENLNTGLVGRVIRRGTTYLICVTEDKIMFKSWIKDVMEAVVNYPGPSGVPANQREVGTDAHFKYVARLTGQDFINKYRKK